MRKRIKPSKDQQRNKQIHVDGQEETMQLNKCKKKYHVGHAVNSKNNKTLCTFMKTWMKEYMPIVITVITKSVPNQGICCDSNKIHQTSTSVLLLSGGCPTNLEILQVYYNITLHLLIL